MIQSYDWKKKNWKDPRISRFFGVASDLSVVGEIILLSKDKIIWTENERRRFVVKGDKIDLKKESGFLAFPNSACKEIAQNSQSCQVTQDRKYDQWRP